MDVVTDVRTVIVLLGLALCGTLAFGWAAKKPASNTRSGFTHVAGSIVACVVSGSVLVAAGVANIISLDPSAPRARIAFILVGMVGLAGALLVNNRTRFWPVKIIVGTYVLTIAAALVLLVIGAIWPIEPLFTPKNI